MNGVYCSYIIDVVLMYSWIYFGKVNRLGNSKSISQFKLTLYEVRVHCLLVMA